MHPEIQKFVQYYNLKPTSNNPSRYEFIAKAEINNKYNEYKCIIEPTTFKNVSRWELYFRDSETDQLILLVEYSKYKYRAALDTASQRFRFIHRQLEIKGIISGNVPATYMEVYVWR